jgi:D-ribulokinase
MDRYFIGVDVGTGSARAGVFDQTGALLGSAKRAFATWREAGHIVEQSSEEIWAAVCASVREAVAASGVAPEAVGGIGFDATCSLAVVDVSGKPLAVGPSGDPNRNVIVWMDHRAGEQAQAINATGQAVLNYVGGAISLEMETPKLLWLLQNKPETFAAAGHFFDLSDYLTWRATGSLDRSVCTVTCKWTYLAHEKRWDEAYFRTIGLGILADEQFVRMGTNVVDAATPLGKGLTAEAAEAFGLRPGVPVGAALIDAHAGGIGTVGATNVHADAPPDPRRRLAYIYGTSACAMATTAEATFVPGVWGPYFSAMVPGMWLNEGGQSAAGAALDHLLLLHPAHAAAVEAAAKAGKTLLAWLEDQAVGQMGSLGETARLASRIHVVPEFLGNRAPFSDPDARATIAGLGLESSLESLIALYVAGLCGIAYGARQIVAALKAQSVPLDQLIVSGGAALSPLVRQILADGAGLEVGVAATPEPILLGSAILGAVAGGAFPTVSAGMAAMSRLGSTYQPSGGAIEAFHHAKFRIYSELQKADRSSRSIMAAAGVA